jgi:hypothetical protein
MGVFCNDEIICPSAERLIERVKIVKSTNAAGRNGRVSAVYFVVTET